ncbi:hypothetical protein AgCh_005236 [Apium graveolens]
MSRTHSVSSKHSIISSRSNNTNSRSSSSCYTSGRTSTSDVSERRVVMSRVKSLEKKPEQTTNRPSLSPHHRGWHYVTQTPVLNRKVSRKSRAEAGIQQGSKRKKIDDKGKRNGWLFWRICRCSDLDL